MDREPVRLLKLLWPDIDDLIRRLSQQIKESLFEPDVIIAVARGGLIPATALSHALGVRTIGFIDIRRTESDRILSLPPEGLVNKGVYLPAGHHDRILLVDDIIGYGHTIVEACATLRGISRTIIVRPVVLLVDCNLPKTNDLRIQEIFYGREMKGYDWAVFPWEAEPE